MLIARWMPLLAAALVPSAAWADAFTLEGEIAHHNDVVQIAFSLHAAPAEVRLWTDSWQGGLNFDPAIALWRAAAGGDYELVALNDDDDGIGAGQGWYDAGLRLPVLGAGEYRVTLVATFNAPLGERLSQGFAYDAETPIPIGQWDQPTYDPNANDQKGPLWRLQLTGVDHAAVVPEPATWLLLGLGVATLVGRRRGLGTD